MSPRHLIDRGGADALGVRVRRRADRRRDIAQRARVRRRSASCRRRPTSAYGSVIRPVMTLCAARRPLSMRSAGCGEPRGTTQSIANRLSAEKKRLAGSRGAGVPFCGKFPRNSVALSTRPRRHQQMWSGRDSTTRFQTKSTPHVEFSPQTPHDVAVASSMQVDLLSLESTMVFHTLTRFNDPVLCASFRGDGRMLVAGDAGGKTHIFDLRSHALMRIFGVHSHAVRPLPQACAPACSSLTPPPPPRSTSRDFLPTAPASSPHRTMRAQSAGMWLQRRRCAPSRATVIVCAPGGSTPRRPISSSRVRCTVPGRPCLPPRAAARRPVASSPSHCRLRARATLPRPPRRFVRPHGPALGRGIAAIGHDSSARSAG